MEDVAPPVAVTPPAPVAPPVEPPWPPFFLNTTVPVKVGPAPCGVQLIVLPETQYAYFLPLSVSVVITLFEVVYLPFVGGSTDIMATPAGIWTVAEQVHPPPLAASVQVTES
jgi:hypothetical protein